MLHKREIRILGEIEAHDVVEIRFELRRAVPTQLGVRAGDLRFLNATVTLLRASGLDILPGQATFKDADNDVAERDEVVSTREFDALMRV